MEKDIQNDTNKTKFGVGRLISRKADFKMIKIINEKEGNYIMIKYSILQEDITTLNIYAPSNRILWSKHIGGKIDRILKEQ